MKAIVGDKTGHGADPRPLLRPIWLLLDASGFGGIERHVEVLAQGLRDSGLRSEIVFWDGNPPQSWTQRLSLAGQPWQMLDGRLRTLAGAIREEKPLLLHTHGYKANIMGRLAGRMCGLPVVASFHAGLRERMPVGLYQRIDEATCFLGGRIAVSEAIQASLPFSSNVVENFIPMPPPPAPTPLPKRAAFVGRLNHEKGIDLFCEIAREVGPAIAWDVYGEGPLREPLETMFGELVSFRGFASDMCEVWRNTGLLVMPSRAEGLPMAALEALAHGVPVAAARVGGLPNAIIPGASGWLFDVGDTVAAIQAIKTWSSLDAEEQAALRLSSWRRVEARYSAEIGLTRVLDVYASHVPVLRNIPRSAVSNRPSALGRVSL